MKTALDNVSLLAQITSRSGTLLTEPSPAARSYFQQKVTALRESPTAHDAFLMNAWLPWATAFENPRSWDSYTNKLATRQTRLGVTTVMVDAHDVPGSVQNNPNDEQNELRFKRYRPNYRQHWLTQNRDEFTPVTIDGDAILRLFAEGGPDSTNVSNFASSQITMAQNADGAREFHTLMQAIGRAAEQPNLHHIQVPRLRPGATEAEALQWASSIRTAVLALADFAPFFTPAGNTTTVPKTMVRLAVRQSAMQLLGAIAYSSSYNPEYVFALPEDQIVELPDHYFDRHPGLNRHDAFIVDAGTDTAYGSLVVVDTVTRWGVDRFDIKNSENRAYHHASILDVNPYKTFMTVGADTGTAYITPQIVPESITGVVYGPDGVIVENGELERGTQYSTRGIVADADGFAAGGSVVEIVSDVESPTSSTEIGLYNTLKIGMDETASTVRVRFTSLINEALTVEHTFTLTGQAQAYNGSGALIVGGTVSYANGAITYTTATGEVAEISADGGNTWTTAPASPITIPSGQTRRFRKRASQGYVYPSGAAMKMYGPWTAA